MAAEKKSKKKAGRPQGVVDQLQVSRALDRSIAELKTLRDHLLKYWKQQSNK